ncbi:MAG: hypothetical protein ABW352_25780 [Polyangiales bacterium]
MALRLVCILLCMASMTVPSSGDAQQLPAFLRVRASDVPVETTSLELAREEARLERRQRRAAQMIAWGAGILVSMAPYAAVAHRMGQKCYDHPQTLRTQFWNYGVLGTAGLALATTGIVRLLRLPEGYAKRHPLPPEQRTRAANVAGLVALGSLGLTSFTTTFEMGICGSS